MKGLDNDIEPHNEEYVMSPNIPFPELLEELKWQGKKYHAQIVYRKCLQHKHYKWAMIIASKYDIPDISNDDRVMSAAMCLMASKKTD